MYQGAATAFSVPEAAVEVRHVARGRIKSADQRVLSEADALKEVGRLKVFGRHKAFHAVNVLPEIRAAQALWNAVVRRPRRHMAIGDEPLAAKEKMHGS